MNSRLQIKGYVNEFIDGDLVNKTVNQIHSDLYARVAEFVWVNTVDGELLGDNALMDVGDVRVDDQNREPAINQAGHDGICVYDGNYGTDRPYFSMETTISNQFYGSNNLGHEFTGSLTAGEARQVEALYIGAAFTTGSIFDNIYAQVDKTGSPTNLSENQLYEVTWGIAIG